jgi:6-pyruvoyltetrahydropterin/6-carboxytetrahydropterin synthase
MTRRYRFCASHRLHSDQLSELQNQRTYGKCNNPYGHGHDYILDVSVSGSIDATTGLIVRLSTLDRLVANEVLAAFGHRNLNQDVSEFAQLVPTTENIALVIADRLSERWADYFTYSAARLSGISMHETDRNSCEVRLPSEILRVRSSTAEFEESVTVNG